MLAAAACVLITVALVVLAARRGPGGRRQVPLGEDPSAKTPCSAVGPSAQVAPTPPQSAKVAISFSLPARIPDLGRPIPGGGVNSWIINPNGSFSITLYQTTEHTACEIKRLLDQRFTREGEQGSFRSIQPFFLRNDVRCKEIDDYVADFRPIYLQKINELKSSSAEWAAASERDREDLMEGFRAAAISVLNVKPAFADLKVLLGDTPDLTGTGQLVIRFGLDLIDTYARFAVGERKVLNLPVGHRSRPALERLVEAGLARRGGQIPVRDILGTLTVKELRALAVAGGGRPPKLARKEQAVEYAASLNDITQRLASIVALREFFQLMPLPPEFARLGLASVVAALSYTRELTVLLSETYTRVGYDFLDRRGLERASEAASWEFATQRQACPMCKRAASAVAATKGPRPGIPLHIGCACQVWPRW